MKGLTKIRVGIPGALMYHLYFPLWQTFLNELGTEVVLVMFGSMQVMFVGFRMRGKPAGLVSLNRANRRGAVATLQKAADQSVVDAAITRVKQLHNRLNDE